MFLRSFQGSGGILRPPAIPKLINGTSNEPQLITINHMQGTQAESSRIVVGRQEALVSNFARRGTPGIESSSALLLCCSSTIGQPAERRLGFYGRPGQDPLIIRDPMLESVRPEKVVLVSA